MIEKRARRGFRLGGLRVNRARSAEGDPGDDAPAHDITSRRIAGNVGMCANGVRRSTSASTYSGNQSWTSVARADSCKPALRLASKLCFARVSSSFERNITARTPGMNSPPCIAPKPRSGMSAGKGRQDATSEVPLSNPPEPIGVGRRHIPPPSSEFSVAVTGTTERPQ